MTSFSSNRKFSRVVLAATIGMAMVIGCAGSFAQAADEDDDELLDTKIFRGILKGLGLRKDEPTGIEYRERSPLVLPTEQGIAAGRKLMPPQRRQPAGRTIPTSSGSSSARRRSANARVSQEGVDDKPLLPSQMTENAPARQRQQGRRSAGKISGRRRPRPAPMPNWAPRASPTMFRLGFGRRRKNTSPFTGEPPRSSLTEPPPGYRTPSPTQPYGVGREKWVAPAIDKNEPVK